MPRLGIALDLGTSGFRGQAIDLGGNGAILSTAVTTRHPLPGANVIDHLHFALEVGLGWAHEIMVRAVNRVIENLRIERSHVVRLAVCGNPIQLSLFQEIEFRDLAFAGQRKLESLGVVPPKRDAQILKAREIRFLDIPEDAEVLIPPAVRHEIGADALAMMIQTGMLEKDEIAIVTDYGTNAEMALIVRGTVYTGSTAAGPALEGQQIQDGLLALPGAICDVDFVPEEHEFAGSLRTAGSRPIPGTMQSYVLDGEMNVRPGDAVDPVTGDLLEKGELKAVGITGTGVVALLSQGMRARLIQIPRIHTPDAQIHLADGIKFTEKDLLEAGKAIGSVRAGHITLCQEAGIGLEDIETAYMSGASGTYVDALKAREIGMIPARVKRIYQVGNTSLAMARDLVSNPDRLRSMKEIADHLRQHHCMFAASKVFEKVYILELSHWTEGMPLAQYRKFLGKYGYPPLVEATGTPQVIKTVKRDIPDLGVMGLKIIPDIGQRKSICFAGCIGDASCVAECPENALEMDQEGDSYKISIDLSLCDGVACRRCERVCSQKGFDLVKLVTCGEDEQNGGQRPETRSQRSEVRGQRSEIQKVRKSKMIRPNQGIRATDKSEMSRAILDALTRSKGIVEVCTLSVLDRQQILDIEEETEKRSLMGLGRVINTGVREVLNCDLIYVALTSMDFDWGCKSALVMKKGNEVVGEEIRDKDRIEGLTGQKNVWFLHRNFVVYKDRVCFPQDIMKKNCHFEIRCLPADWCVLEDEALQTQTILYANPSTPCDQFLKNQYFRGSDEKGLGTILIGVK
jgi:methylamine methyltransferase corrinoid protein reductive activase